MKKQERIVIAGGGYAGVRAAFDIANTVHTKPIELILISSSEYHMEIPSFYEVATAYLERESIHSSEYVCQGIGVPLHELFQGLPITVLVKKIQYIEPNERMMMFEDKTTMSFDRLLIGIGTELATFKVPGVLEYSFNVKTLHDALRLRHHIVHLVFRSKTLQMDDKKRALTFIVVGGGSAGVEIAAELAGLLKRLCRHRGIEPTLPKIVLLEAGSSILHELPPAAQQKGRQRLEALGITILTNHRVTTIENSYVQLDSGMRMPTSTVIWSGGLAVHPLLLRSGFATTKWGITVDDTLQIKQYPAIFAAGDCALLEKNPLPAIAPVAIEQGALAAMNILRSLEGKKLKSFHYVNKGHYIAIGGRYALAVFPSRLMLSGILAWLLRKLITLHYWMRLLSFSKALSLWWRGVTVQSKND